MKFEMQRMNSAEKSEAHDVSEQRMDTIFANARFLRVVKISRRFKIFSSVCKNDNLLQRRRRSLSCSTLRNCASPASAFALRAARTSPCHSGDSRSCCSLERDAQSHSIACSRSALLRRDTSSFNSAALIRCKHSSRDRHAQELRPRTFSGLPHDLRLTRSTDSGQAPPPLQQKTALETEPPRKLERKMKNGARGTRDIEGPSRTGGWLRGSSERVRAANEFQWSAWAARHRRQSDEGRSE
jgi:hypothetical protein